MNNDNNDGPKPYIIDPDTLESTTLEGLEEKTAYRNVERIVLLVEDESGPRENLEKTANRYFGRTSGVSICTATNIDEALRELERYKEDSPDARLAAVLDYNMGKSKESRKPTEALFYEPVFQHYLKNDGGVVIFNSGYPAQIRQSEEIMESPRKYGGLLFLLAAKGDVPLEDIFLVVKSATPERIPEMKRVAEKKGYDLGKLL
jgi:hypothetical protein